MGVLRMGGDMVLNVVVMEVVRLWSTPAGEWEHQVNEVMGVLLCKKGDRQKLGNYRTIMLFALVSRIMAKVAALRVRKHSEGNGLLPESQWGFREYRSTAGPLFVLRILMDSMAANGNASMEDAMLMLLLGIYKAYPRVPRNAAWKLFSKLGMRDGFIEVLQGIHDNAKYVVTSSQGVSHQYSMSRGVREGCPSPPGLFNLCTMRW